jgi:hypothetical protein
VIQSYTSNLRETDGNFIKIEEFGGLTLVFRKYAALLFCCVIDEFESEFAINDLIHIIVELFDKVFKDCREIDIIMNPEKVKGFFENFLLDEYFG